MSKEANALMTQTPDRRNHIRKVGQGLVVLIDGRVHPVVDISIAGISFQAAGHTVGTKVSLKIARISDINDCIGGTITIKSAGDTTTRGEFLPTMPLLRYIIGHIGEATGTKPAYFKE
ncbi:MAG: PilZ domain-containing protein [Phaeospirillum sp.]|nr:PilZ domain-containing protein [Phaeospirillum sp.]